MTLEIKKINVLVVDDEAHGLSALTEIIQETDQAIQCRQATSVRSALQSAKENPPGILIADYHLGDGNAFDITSQLNLKHKSVIVSADAKVKEKAEKKGIPFLMKPVELNEMESALQPMLLNKKN